MPCLQTDRLVDHTKSLEGKEFRQVMQGQPFVIFPLLTKAQRSVWISMAHMCSLIYQPEIQQLDQYCQELETRILFFLTKVFTLTAQWANKGKFHALTHLPEQVSRFGPPSNLVTNAFELKHGCTRNDSVHSPRHNPGKHIGESSPNWEVLRHIFTGGWIYENAFKAWRAPPPSLLALTKNHMQIRKLLSYYLDLPEDTTPNNPSKANYSRAYQNNVILPNGQKAKPGDFIAVCFINFL